MPSRRELVLGAAAVMAGASLGLPAHAKAPSTRHGFNDDGIEWRLFEDGAAEAAKSGKPIFFVAHAGWCVHCRSYRKLFYDKEVVERLKGFVPVLVDADAQPEINERFAVNKAYVPRTMFLDSKAELQPDLHLPYPEYVYFVDYLDGPKDLRKLLTMAEAHFKGGRINAAAR